MRIGILTLHSNTNFGGGLQQIALYEVLKSMGHNPQIVCVQNDAPQSKWRRILGVFYSYSFSGIIKEWLKRTFEKKAYLPANYDLFRKCDAFNYEKLNYTPKFGLSDFPRYCQSYDAIIVGSDQVWTDVYSSVNPFFCDCIGDYKGLRISYAACSAHDKVPFYNRSHLYKSLSAFDAISVRDKTTSSLVSNLGLPAPTIVADPTLIYDFSKYITPSPIEEPFIFAYVLGEHSEEWHKRNLSHIFSQIGKMKVVALTTELVEDFSWADLTLTDKLFVDWMNLLRGARFVYTNSFHAVLFSLKFHKDFVAYYGDLVRSSRMLSLQKQFGLFQRIVKDPSIVDLTDKVNFIRTDQIIKELKAFSLNWLEKKLIVKSENQYD